MTARYSLSSILLHWSMALAIALAWGGAQLAEAMARGAGRSLALGTHALLGLAVLALLLPRLLARLLGTSPGHAPGAPAWEARLATAAHVLLYALMLALPLTGLLLAMTGRAPFDLAGLATLPNALAGTGMRGVLKEAHEILADLMLGAVGLHVAAVLWHALVRRDGVAARMRPGGAREA